MEFIDFATPKTISEAVEMMASKGDRARAMAGGTDVLVQLRGGGISADHNKRRHLWIFDDASTDPNFNK